MQNTDDKIQKSWNEQFKILMESTDFSNEPIVKLHSIIEELYTFVASSVSYSSELFCEKVKNSFKDFNFKNFSDSAEIYRNSLLNFSSDRTIVLLALYEFRQDTFEAVNTMKKFIISCKAWDAIV